VETTRQYSAAEMERMMKVQDVLLKAMAKKITWWDAAEIIGVTDRTMRRWRERLDQDGYSGLGDRRKGKPSVRRVPLAIAEEVLRMYKEIYYDLNMRHFHEKLKEEHGIELSYTGAAGVARSWLSRQAAETRQASAEKRTAADDWDAAAYRREQAPVVR
jgi:transposase